MPNTNINVYPDKNEDIIVRWVVEYTDKNGDKQQLFKESEEKAQKCVTELEKPEDDLNELVNGEDGGLIHGDQPLSVGAVGSTEIGSKQTTDDFIDSTRQGMTRAMMYRKFYGEAVEPEIPSKPARIRNSKISGVDTKFLSKEITEVDKTVEALGGIYAQSTDPIDFENKAKLAGYDKDEIEARQERFFRKTSEDQAKTNNPKIPLEEVDIVEDVLTDRSQRNDIVSRTKDQQTSNEYSIPYYDQLKEKNPLIARKLLYLIDVIRRDNNSPTNKASIIWQILNGIGVKDLRPEDKQYIIKFIQNG